MKRQGKASIAMAYKYEGVNGERSSRMKGDGERVKSRLSSASEHREPGEAPERTFLMNNSRIAAFHSSSFLTVTHLFSLCKHSTPPLSYSLTRSLSLFLSFPPYLPVPRSISFYLTLLLPIRFLPGGYSRKFNH
jgi:hypothetical protein